MSGVPGWMIALVVGSSLILVAETALSWLLDDQPSVMNTPGKHYFAGPRAVCIHCNVSMYDLWQSPGALALCEPPKKYPGILF